MCWLLFGVCCLLSFGVEGVLLCVVCLFVVVVCCLLLVVCDYCLLRID